jgi:hypothetical protein
MRPPCGVDGCDRSQDSLGYCKSHAQRLRRFGEPGPARFRPVSRSDDEVADPDLQCQVDECTRRKWARDYCPTHYRRWSRWGDPDVVHRKPPQKTCTIGDCDLPHMAQGLCNPHYQRQYRASNPRPEDDHRQYSRRWILKQYGMTGEDFANLVRKQHNRCAVCKSASPGHNGHKNTSWCVDHDHVTGQVRGLLCRRCNVALGLLNDDPAVVRAAARYIQQHRQMVLPL